MTTRRQARAEVIATAGTGAPSELYRADAASWQTPDAFRRFLTAHGWLEQASLLVWTRETHPANRRNAAADAWGLENGITVPDWPQHADWHRLREMGLVA